jgi:predicted RNase H-like nuclease (RuvC/YqgF family)
MSRCKHDYLIGHYAVCSKCEKEIDMETALELDRLDCQLSATQAQLNETLLESVRNIDRAEATQAELEEAKTLLDDIAEVVESPIMGRQPIINNIIEFKAGAYRGKETERERDELREEQKAWRKFTDEANATMDKAEAENQSLRTECERLKDENRKLHDIAGSYSMQINRLESELAALRRGMERIAEYKAESLTDQYYALGRLTKIAREALGMGDK